MSAAKVAAVFQDHRARILIVDDEPVIRTLLSRWLEKEGYDCAMASNAKEAWERLQNETFELLVSDIIMPGESGMTLLSKARRHFGDELATIMVTGVDDRQTAVQALELGAYGYIIKPFNENEVIIGVRNSLERRRLTLQSKSYAQRLEAEVRARTAEVRSREMEIILRLMSAAEYRDDETGAHIRRIGLYSTALAKAAGWKDQEAHDIQLTATMHDIGKIGVPDHVLLKPAKLTPEEFQLIKTHTETGGRILGGTNIPLLISASNIAMYHHEKWDGAGYPRGLAGKAIPESARIVAIADVYDALVNPRVYRPAFPEDEALNLMHKEREKHFDPLLFDCFLSILPEFQAIRRTIDAVETELEGITTPPVEQR